MANSLIDAALAGQSKGPACGAGVWLDSLSKSDRAEVEGAFAVAELQHASLAREIRKRWPEAASADSLIRHRKGECACGSR